MNIIKRTILDSLTKVAGDANAKREALLFTIASLFVLVNSVALSLTTDGGIRWSHLYAPTVWFFLFVLAFFLLHRRRPNHDPYLLPLMGFLTGWGLLLMDRLAPGFLLRQVRWLILGITALTIVVYIPGDFGFLRRYRYTWLTLGILLLGATFVFGVNPSGQGAALWLKVPFVRQVFFQPSELLKLLLVVFLASYFDERGRILRLIPGKGWQRTLAYLGPLALMGGFCVLMLVWQRDLGAATLFLGLFLAMLYLATGDWIYVIGGIALLIIASLVGYYVFDDIAAFAESFLSQGIGTGSRMAQLAGSLESVNDIITLRIDTWINPWPEADTRGYQIIQSLYAVATGGLSGQGIAQGNPLFIPVVHSDFAFAAVAEEWGLLGTLVIISCFATIAYRGLRIAAISLRSFGLFLASGITIVFTFQAFLIMAGVTRLLPLTGITLPFVSYGGSSLLASSIMIGLLLNLSSQDMRSGRSRPETIKEPGQHEA